MDTSSNNLAPIITTKRFHLRPHIYADWPDYLAFMKSKRAMPIGGPFDDEAAWKWFANDVSHWPLFGLGSVAITLKENNHCIGQISFNKMPTWPEPEIGWLVYERWSGQGVIIEAALAFKSYIQSSEKVGSLVSYIDRDNERSIKVAEKLGAKLDPIAKTPMGDNCLVYRHW